jgi:hypothetical protein
VLVREAGGQRGVHEAREHPPRSGFLLQVVALYGDVPAVFARLLEAARDAQAPPSEVDALSVA